MTTLYLEAPNKVMVGPWSAVQYVSVDLAEAEAALEQAAEEHPDDCPWWGDWHRCSCGAFDAPKKT